MATDRKVEESRLGYKNLSGWWLMDQTCKSDDGKEQGYSHVLNHYSEGRG